MDVTTFQDLQVLENKIRLALQQYRLDQVLLGLRTQNKLEPFMVAGLTLFALRYSPPRFYKKSGPALRWSDLGPIAHLVNLYLLADPLSFDKKIQDDYYESNYVFTILRIVGSQFPYGVDFFGQYARSLILYEDLPQQLALQPDVPRFDLAAAFQHLNGVPLTDFIKVGFVAFTAAQSTNQLGFTRGYFEKARTEGFDLPSDAEILSVLEQLAATPEKFNESYRQSRQSDPKFAMYNLNPLLLYPIVRPFHFYRAPKMDKDALIAPLPNLILSRLSTGIFYQLFNHYKENFSQYFGRLFEAYIGVALKNCINSIKLLSETDIRKTYPIEEGKAPDRAIIDGATAIFFECKATRFTRAALVKGDENAIDDSLKQVIKGLKQLSEFTVACKAQKPGLEHFHKCTNFYSVVVTPELLYLTNSKPFRKHIDQVLANRGVVPLSWLTLSVNELEALQPHIKGGISFGDVIDKLYNMMFNKVMDQLHAQTGFTYKDSFLYSKEQELYQLLNIADKLLDT